MKPSLAGPHGDLISDWIEEIKSVWSRGTGRALELAKVVVVARRRLHYGEWTQLWKSSLLPFSKRKGEMLVVIGDRLGWIDAQMFADLPAGWSVLYCLAQLNRPAFENLLQEGTIHPRLTLREARDVVAKFQDRPNKNESRTASVRQRLRRFGDFVRNTVSEWEPEERALVKRELTRLMELIELRTASVLSGRVESRGTAFRPNDSRSSFRL